MEKARILILAVMLAAAPITVNAADEHANIQPPSTFISIGKDANHWIVGAWMAFIPYMMYTALML